MVDAMDAAGGDEQARIAAAEAFIAAYPAERGDDGGQADSAPNAFFSADEEFLFATACNVGSGSGFRVTVEAAALHHYTYRKTICRCSVCWPALEWAVAT